MLEFIFPHAGHLRRILECLGQKGFLDCVNLKCDATHGLQLRSLAASDATFVTLTINKDQLPHYRCDTTMYLGIKLAEFITQLRAANADDHIEFRAEEDAKEASFDFYPRTQAGFSSCVLLRLMFLP